VWSTAHDIVVDSSWNVMAHGAARKGKWRGNWRMQWVASTLHTTSEHGVSSITTADARTSAASSRLNWRPHWFKWNCPFRWKTKSGFCVCAITFKLASSTTHRQLRFNLLKTKHNLLYVRNQSYRAVHTFHHGYKGQSVNDIKQRLLSWDPYKTLSAN
jgi:hypothetical protein